jgi:hypothetical protein
VTGQLHVPCALLPEKNVRFLTGQEAVLTPETSKDVI